MKKSKTIVLRIISVMMVVYITISFYYPYLMSRRYLFSVGAVLLLTHFILLPATEKVKTAILIVFLCLLVLGKIELPNFDFLNPNSYLSLNICLNFFFILLSALVLFKLIDLISWLANIGSARAKKEND